MCVPWTPDFNPLNPKGILFPVWVELPFLPSEFFAVLDSAWEAIGKVALAEPANFFNDRPHARACLLLDLSEALPETISFCSHDGRTIRTQQVRYFNVPSYCSYCCSSGHVIRSCPKKPVRPVPPTPMSSPNFAPDKASSPVTSPIHTPNLPPPSHVSTAKAPNPSKNSAPLLPLPPKSNFPLKDNSASVAIKGKNHSTVSEPGWSTVKTRSRGSSANKSQMQGLLKNQFEVLSSQKDINDLAAEVIATDVVAQSPEVIATDAVAQSPSKGDMPRDSHSVPSSMAGSRRPRASPQNLSLGVATGSLLSPASLEETPANNTRKKSKRKQLEVPTLVVDSGPEAAAGPSSMVV